MNQKFPLEVLYEDDAIIVCKKPPGIATQSKNARQVDLESQVKRHLYQQAAVKKEPYLAVIHRLDQPVSGILVFAKTPYAAKELNTQLQKHGFGKHYKALLTHCPSKELEGKSLVHYMKKDGKTNTSHICPKSDSLANEARLQFQLITNPSEQDWKLFEHCNIVDYASVTPVHITLDTGRHHQIRVQMSHIGCAIWGDSKYGTTTSTQWEQIALCAYKLEFQHPITKKALLFEL